MNYTINTAHKEKGIVLVSFTSYSNKKAKVRISCGERQQHFAISTDGTVEVYPLCFGNGEYQIGVYEEIQKPRYKRIGQDTVKVVLNNEFEPYLRPNVYCSYTPISESILKAKELCAHSATDIARFKNIYWWVLNNVTYDKELAKKITTEDYSWWLPMPDAVIRTGKAICRGYASLLAAMCRSQGIPCKICVGIAGTAYHAWNEVYLTESALIHGIFYDKNIWTRTDLTFMDASEGKLADFILDNTNFHVDYYG